MSALKGVVASSVELTSESLDMRRTKKGEERQAGLRSPQNCEVIASRTLNKLTIGSTMKTKRGNHGEARMTGSIENDAVTVHEYHQS
jgi:hypothetical protein